MYEHMKYNFPFILLWHQWNYSCEPGRWSCLGNWRSDGLSTKDWQGEISHLMAELSYSYMSVWLGKSVCTAAVTQGVKSWISEWLVMEQIRRPWTKLSLPSQFHICEFKKAVIFSFSLIVAKASLPRGWPAWRGHWVSWERDYSPELSEKMVGQGQKAKVQDRGNKAELGHIKTGQKDTHIQGVCTSTHSLGVEQEG